MRQMSTIRFDVMFDYAVCLEPGKAYDIVSLIKGPSSWYVFGGENMTRFKESSFHLVVQLLLVMKLMLAMASFLHLFSAQCSTFFKIP